MEPGRGKLYGRGRQLIGPTCQLEEAEPAVLGRPPWSPKKRWRSSSPRRTSTLNCRMEAKTEGTVRSTLAAHSMSAPQTVLHDSTLHVTDAPVKTLPSPMNFPMVSFTLVCSETSGRAKYRNAALLSSFPFTPKKGLELPRTSSGSCKPLPPTPASRLRRLWLARFAAEYAGACRSVSSKVATTEARRLSNSTAPNAPGIGCVVPPAGRAPTSEAYAPKVREAGLEAPASCAAAATPTAVRTAVAAAAPPRPVKSITSD